MEVIPFQTETIPRNITTVDNLSYALFEAVQVDKYYNSQREQRHIQFPEALQMFKESGKFSKWNAARERQFAERQNQEISAMTKKNHPETIPLLSKFHPEQEHDGLSDEERNALLPYTIESALICSEQGLAKKHRDKKDHNPIPHGVHLIIGIVKKTMSGEYWAKLLQEINSEVYVSPDVQRHTVVPYQFTLEGTSYIDGKSEHLMRTMQLHEGDQIKIIAYGHDKHKLSDTKEKNDLTLRLEDLLEQP